MSRQFRLTWHGPRVTSLLGLGIEAGLGDAADHLLEAANERVPIEELALRESGKASVDGKRAAVSYDTEYAVIQHEKSYRHDPGRTRKYLEIPWLNERDEMGRLIASACRRHLGL